MYTFCVYGILKTIPLSAEVSGQLIHLIFKILVDQTYTSQSEFFKSGKITHL